MELLGLLITLVADFCLIILALHLVLAPRQFYFSPALATLRRPVEPLLKPLRRVLPSPALATLAAMLVVLLLKGLLLTGLGLTSSLTWSSASAEIQRSFYPT